MWSVIFSEEPSRQDRIDGLENVKSVLVQALGHIKGVRDSTDDDEGFLTGEALEHCNASAESAWKLLKGLIEAHDRTIGRHKHSNGGR